MQPVKIYFEHCGEKLGGIVVACIYDSTIDESYFITLLSDETFLHVNIIDATTKPHEENDLDNMEF